MVESKTYALTDWDRDVSTRVSIVQAVSFAFRFLQTRFGAIVGRIILPLLLAAFILYASMDAYAGFLMRFLARPDDGTAGLALGFAVGGVLLFLFLHAMIAVSIAELAFGIEDKGRLLRLRAGRREWRLYAATLRLILISACCAAIAGGISWGLQQAAGPFHTGGSAMAARGTKFIFGALFFLLSARFGLLMAPLVLAEDGQIIRRAWRLTKGNFWRIAAIILILLVPGFAIRTLGEYWLRAGGIVPAMKMGFSLLDAASAFRHMLLWFLFLITLSYLADMILLGAGAVSVYRQLALRDAARR